MAGCRCPQHLLPAVTSLRSEIRHQIQAMDRWGGSSQNLMALFDVTAFIFMVIFSLWQVILGLRLWK